MLPANFKNRGVQREKIEEKFAEIEEKLSQIEEKYFIYLAALVGPNMYQRFFLAFSANGRLKMC